MILSNFLHISFIIFRSDLYFNYNYNEVLSQIFNNHTCDIHGLFHPAMALLSAGDRDNEQRGELINFSSVP